MNDILNKLLEYIKKLHPDYEIILPDDRFYSEDVERIILEKGDDRKSFFYNHRLDRMVSNVIDGAYTIKLHFGNLYTLHSYKIGDKVRVFLAITNTDIGKVYSVGYDLNKKEFMVFPIDEKGLIYEDGMVTLLKLEDSSIGVEPSIYKDNLKIGNLYYVLRGLNTTNEFEVTNKLVSYNQDEIDVCERITRERRKYHNK